MNNTTLFWGLSAGLSCLMLVFLGKLKNDKHLFVLSACGIIGLAYLLYALWGSPVGIPAYYHEDNIALREKYRAMRPLLVRFRKAEQRYLLRIEANPNDRDAWLNLAQIYLIQQDKERAAYAARQAELVQASSLKAIAP